MANLAIKGHATRGKEVIKILKMLGGYNIKNWIGDDDFSMYFINEDGNIICSSINYSIMKVFTIEEFLKKYPYKVGDNVYNIVHNENQTITNLIWDFQENEVVYQTNNNEYVYVNYLQPYKEERQVNQINQSIFMTKLAIKGHATRGKEVIEILKMLGGINKYNLSGDTDEWFVLNGTQIQHSNKLFAEKSFTLEEFLEKFPYKIGDKVQHKWATPQGFVYEVEGMRWEECTVKYALCLLGSNYKRSTLPAEHLQPYKEERHVNQITEDIFIDQRTSKCSLIVLQPDVCDNEVEIQLGDYEIEERDGKTFAVLKKKKFNMDSFCEAINPLI